MPPTAFIAISIIIINLVVSYQGLRSAAFFDRYSFNVENILVNKEYIRMVSSGFLHVSWLHLFVNMISFYLFSNILELYMGSLPFTVVYIAGLLGGNLLALLIHRHHGDYSAAGASGAVCGVIFATIALFPGINIFPFMIPLPIPGWIFGLAYILYSIYGIRSKADNIGHEAHLGGALVGMFTALGFHYTAFADNLFTISIISVPALFFMYFILKRPQVLYVDNFYYKNHPNATIDDKYNIEKAEQQQHIDAILEKIHQKGMKSLTKAEKEQLDKYSNSQ